MNTRERNRHSSNFSNVVQIIEHYESKTLPRGNRPNLAQSNHLHQYNNSEDREKSLQYSNYNYQQNGNYQQQQDLNNQSNGMSSHHSVQYEREEYKKRLKNFNDSYHYQESPYNKNSQELTSLLSQLQKEQHQKLKDLDKHYRDNSEEEVKEEMTNSMLPKQSGLDSGTQQHKYKYPEQLAKPLINDAQSQINLSSPTQVNIEPRMQYNTDYKNLTPRQKQIYQTMSPTQPNSRALKMVSETSTLSSNPFSPYAGSTAASTIRDVREREKKEMCDLNDRLASYIEKVRFLEAQNRKLATDLDFAKNRQGKDSSSVRDMYESDLNQALKLINETNHQRKDLENQILILKDEINILQQKYFEIDKGRYADKTTIDNLLINLSNLEAEISILKRRIEILKQDTSVLKQDNNRLLTDLQRARNDLDQEMLNRIDYQNQVQTLIEEIDFLQRSHESEILDLQAMASRDTTKENRELFRSELSTAIREIRNEYDQLCNAQRVDIESWYKLKVQEIQTKSVRQNMEESYAKEEVRRLRTQLGTLRGKLADLEGRNTLLEKQAEELNYQLEDDQRSYESALNDRDSQIRKIREECQILMVELQMLLDTKQTLDNEILIYRKMLEGDGDRIGLKQLCEQVVRTQRFKQSDENETLRLLKSESSVRNSYQRTAKGNISITELASDGKYITIENTNRSKFENMSGWKLQHRANHGKKEIFFTFPRDFILSPGKSVKIWAQNQGFNNPLEKLVCNAEEPFSTGNNVHTILYNAQGEERATLIHISSNTFPS